MDIVGSGALITESLLARAELNAKWLLIDFGERKATRGAAREKLMMAKSASTERTKKSSLM